MLCQRCGQRPATTHIKTVVNGQLTESHLCGECAQQQGYGGMLGEWGGFGSLLGGLLGDAPAQEVKRCPGCGASFGEISKSGKIGCAACYQTFREQLRPVIQRIHGAAQHMGKSPGGSALRVVSQEHRLAVGPGGQAAGTQGQSTGLEEKRRQLQEAIKAQDFERAAVLRDEIKEAERHG
ncbi:UvrB/UvrC motif-containing protein [Acutalibacter caecimuris]|uniref:UvrB/UvrC motif-containing protein n=1 Tax=Acutalibacter caecimuris TaxID=3093657 RepID=UPI002AC98EE4|nr:UvrB/UvrC motif-containing protein [Acutalibacter sp. M00118]